MTPELCFDSSSWAKRQLKELFQKSTIKNKDKKITTVISNSAQYGLVKQSEFFDRDIANDKNIDGYYVLRKNDFVYNPRKSSIAPYGPIQRYEYGESGIVSPLYLCFSATKENSIDTTFAKYFFESPTWYSYVYSHCDTGARHDRVSIQDAVFFQMPICLPNLDEQKKIAIFFTSLDRRIDIADKKLAALQTIKKGMLQKIFSQELRFKDNDRREFPAWKKMKIKQIGKFYSGTGFSEKYQGHTDLPI